MRVSVDSTARKPYNSGQRSQSTKVLAMPAPGIYHHVVKNALIKDGWTITHDPYTLTFGQRNVFVDLGQDALSLPKETEKNCGRNQEFSRGV